MLRENMRTIALLLALLVGSCGEPPGWQQLLASKINQQHPGFEVEPTPDGNLIVKRPNLPAVRVDVGEISRLCQRGPKDCDYAVDQMLLSIRP